MVKDLSTFIRDSIEDVENTLILGAIFTVLVVFVFLNSWRSTMITGLTLPVSVISAFIIMKVFGFTLNILTASLVAFPRLGSAFMPEFDRGEFQVAFKSAPGASLEQTESIAKELVDSITHEPGVDYTFTTIGAGASAAINEGMIYVKLRPLAFEIGAGSEIRAPMARAVIGGLITSTLLTLVVVPVVYSLLDDFTSRISHKS